ncbi:hypothetical protein CMUS01_03015 [Colletotrichum musicola]|uniref:Uncharacterized protein n=1 Tax=Colletotrichum musicola TaxID=2175873 RepID=A0A8H6NU24_9PEZI|nr:hypothetical protein CMUS01_03015 [Colletotrichum musicola]
MRPYSTVDRSVGGTEMHTATPIRPVTAPGQAGRESLREDDTQRSIDRIAHGTLRQEAMESMPSPQSPLVNDATSCRLLGSHRRQPPARRPSR